jgi:dTDP-4-dehydrorhamnose reductase
MNILIIGRKGQLAAELTRAVWPRNARVTSLGRPQLDIRDERAVRAAVSSVDPDLIINAAAYTAVDRAETEPAEAFMVNHQGASHLATAAARLDIPLLHVSSDYVFSGRSRGPLRETDETAPACVYGLSKLEGERAIRSVHPRHVILRTSWLFASHGQNFMLTMLRLGAERESLAVVDDQTGCPTAAADLADAIVTVSLALLSGHEIFGTYHYCGRGPITWFDFAEIIFECAGTLVPKPPRLRRITTAEYGAPAKRPAYSVLDCSKIARDFGIVPQPWMVGLQTALSELRGPLGERA